MYIWVKIKYEFGGTYLKQLIKVAFNLNPEVDVGGGVQHTLNCGQIFNKHTHTFSLNNCWICPW